MSNDHVTRMFLESIGYQLYRDVQCISRINQTSSNQLLARRGYEQRNTEFYLPFYLQLFPSVSLLLLSCEEINPHCALSLSPTPLSLSLSLSLCTELKRLAEHVSCVSSFSKKQWWSFKKRRSQETNAEFGKVPFKTPGWGLLLINWCSCAPDNVLASFTGFVGAALRWQCSIQNAPRACVLETVDGQTIL